MAVTRPEKKVILEYISNPDSACLSEQLLDDPTIPRWVFADDPPEESPTLHLPHSQGKMGVWSVKHSCTYLTGLGYLVREGSKIVLSSGPFFGGDLAFSSSQHGLKFDIAFTFNEWKERSTPCRCHLKIPPM